LPNNLEDLTIKMKNELSKLDSTILKSNQEKLDRIENNEKNMQKSIDDFSSFKTDNESKFAEIRHSVSLELKEIKKELSNHSIILENLENKINDNIIYVNRDIGEMIKDVNKIKFELESFRNFKENTVLNFKDIGDEFLKNEEVYKKMTYRINMQIRDFEAKIINFEQNFNLQNDNFSNIKKDIYSQIYDSNMNINSKIQIFNDSFNQKFESFDKIMNDFQNNLLVIK